MWIFFSSGFWVLTSSFLICLSPSFAEEFFEDLRDKTTKGAESARASVSESSQGSLEEQVFKDWLQGSIQAARREQLARLDKKIAWLDSAVDLPEALRKKHRQKQKHLIAYRQKIAMQFVDSQIKESQPKLWQPSHSIDRQGENKVHQEARKIAATLSEPQRKSFLLNWKASLVDSKARDHFATYLALAGLYGTQDPIVQRQNERMNAARPEFVPTESEFSTVPPEEWTDWVYTVLNSHRNRFSLPLRTRFEKVALLENQMILAEGKPKEIQLYQRKLAWEKEVLLEIVKQRGLVLDPEEMDENEDKILEWFVLNQNKLPFLWPLEEKGKLLDSFDKERGPFVILETLKQHGILAPREGQVQGKNDQGFTFYSPPYTFYFRGEIDLLIKGQKKVKRGDRIAELKGDHTVAITVLDVDKPQDLMTFF